MTDLSTIIKTVFFDASPQTVWSYLTDKDKLGVWFHPAESDLSNGADYKLIQKNDDGDGQPIIWGKVLVFDAPRLLKTTFIIKPFGDLETTITWQLEELAGGTRLQLKHEGVAEAAGEATMQMLMSLDKGWDKHFAEMREAVAQ